MKKPELLAPAGNLKKLKYAFAYGADAVYCGLPSFSLRAKTGFDLKSLKEGIDYAHNLNKKVYITINIFAHNRHLKTLPKHLQALNKIKPDAIILSDPGVMMLVKRYLPKTEIHLSTQANTLNTEAIKFWKSQGVKRVILGRETSLNDFKEMEKTVKGVELEIFVHGAMCMSYSGRCYMSAWINNRSANEGLCTQPCRWNYKLHLEEPLHADKPMHLESDQHGTYVMNSKDLCLIDYLDEIIKANIISLKLEGRTKSIYYLAVAVRAYRQAIDLIFSKKTKSTKTQELKIIKEELYKVDNREYTTGFFLGTEEAGRQNFKNIKGKCEWSFAGEVLEKKQDRLIIRVHNILKNNRSAEIVTPTQNYKIKITDLQSSSGQKIQKANGGTEKTFSFEVKKNLDIPVNSILRIKRDNDKK